MEREDIVRFKGVEVLNGTSFRMVRVLLIPAPLPGGPIGKWASVQSCVLRATCGLQ